MSRYPGTQFKVYDNSQVAAIVPVNTSADSSAVTYLSAFRSVKGPEKITYTRGNDFYTKYGTQDHVKFSKYGQPLFQASMNINNGANLYAKRAVLDDATLGNTTLCVALTKYKDHKITANSTDPSIIESIEIKKGAESKYSLAPLMISIDNSDDYTLASTVLSETKDRYDLYKNYIVDVISNQNSAKTTFLNALGDDDKIAIASGYADSIYYDADGNVITDFTKYSEAHSVSSVSLGSLETNIKKTISTQFSVRDIVDGEFDTKITEDKTVNSDTEAVFGIKEDLYVTGYRYADSNWSVVETTKIGHLNGITDATYKLDSMSKIKYTTVPKDKTTEWTAVAKDFAESIFPNPTEGDIVYITNISDISLYSDPTKFINSLLMTKAECVELEYVFPMFTIFDNGRGTSIKSLSISYDQNTAKTQKKAIYKLSVYNYETGKTLETFSFSLNPYEINPNTGYSYDIESAVNNASEQILVKTYYKSYDKFLETVQIILGTNSDTIISDYDVLFGHTLNGSYPTFSSYKASSVVNRSAYTYDYAHLDIFSNDILTINAYCNEDNMNTVNNDTLVKYYYYDATRNNLGIYERIEYGSDGYNLSITSNFEDSKVVKPVYVVIDSTDTSVSNGISNASQFASLIEATGQPDGTIVRGYNNKGTNYKPTVEFNFVKTKIVVCPVYKCEKTANKTDVIKPENIDHYITANNQSEQIRGYYKVTDIFKDGDTALYAGNAIDTENAIITTVWIPYTEDALYQKHYQMFYNGDFDRNIFNLDVYFPNAVFDANYSKATKLAIQRLAAFRGDFMVYMDMGIGTVTTFNDCLEMIPSELAGLELTESDTNSYYYVRDMHIAVTCLSYDMRDPYTNKIISVTGTYGLSNLYINHFARNSGGVFAGISNGITIGGIIEGTANYIPKIYPTSEMTSINNIGGVYPSDDDTIVNEKQLMCDLRVNYGCYYEDRFSIETEYTMHPDNSEFSYWNNVALVCLMMQDVRKACPSARYKFVTADDLSDYQTAVNSALNPWRNKFASLKFKYLQDEQAIANKIYYAAIEVAFKPFAQAEIFTLTALNYSTLSENVTSI